MHVKYPSMEETTGWIKHTFIRYLVSEATDYQIDKNRNNYWNAHRICTKKYFGALCMTLKIWIVRCINQIK